MSVKSIVTYALLVFVGVSIVVALTRIGNESSREAVSGIPEAPQASNTLISQLADSQYTAVYFHAPHRCPTCKTIEAFAHEALASDIEQGTIAWRVADYTADENKALVKQSEVYTSTVVLIEVRDGQVVRWKNLEEVWNHTSDQAAFSDFVRRSWSDFKAHS